MTTTTIGAGSDTLALGITQDAYQGNAQFTVALDGQQVGGTLTAISLQDGFSSDVVNVLADLAPGVHTATLNFLNDAYGGTMDTDRNLYLDGTTYDGLFVPGVARELQVSGPVTFGFLDSTPAPTISTSTTIGFGPDTLVLNVSQDAYQGNAQFTVSVDGQQVGDVLTASSLHASGSSDTVNVLANLSAGPHTVSVTFLNDAYAGTPDTDLNLYIDSATYDGVAVEGAVQALYSSGPASFGVIDTSGKTVTVSGGTTEASLLDPPLAPGDTLIVRGGATVAVHGSVESDPLAGVNVTLLGTTSTGAANLDLVNATVGSLSLNSVSTSDQAELYSTKLGHLDVALDTTITGGVNIGETRPLGPGFLDVNIRGFRSELALHGVNIQSSSALRISGDQGAAVRNDGLIRIAGGYVTGSVDIQTDLEGNGTISGAGSVATDTASVRLGGEVGSGQTIDLTQVNLQLDQPMRFEGTLAAFNTGRNSGVTLSDETITGTSFQQVSNDVGDLSVFTQDESTGASGATLTFHVAGNFASDAFTFVNNSTAHSALITLA